MHRLTVRQNCYLMHSGHLVSVFLSSIGVAIREAALLHDKRSEVIRCTVVYCWEAQIILMCTFTFIKSCMC